MALADSVPGVSGGTIAFILGFYDDFIGSLNSLISKNSTEDKKKSLIFLIKLGIGWVTGMILSVLILLNVINVIIYLLSIYIVTNKIINKIPERYTYVHKFLIYYKNIRVIYIIGEFIFILVFLIMMISVGYGVVSLYIQYK